MRKMNSWTSFHQRYIKKLELDHKSREGRASSEGSNGHGGAHQRTAIITDSNSNGGATLTTSTPTTTTVCSRLRCPRPGFLSSAAVFLGGSCNPTTWREDIAIPMLKGLGITYYNPQVCNWGPELINLENNAKQSADVLFFVIDNQTRSVTSMIEAAHIAGSQRKLVLVIHHFAGPGACISDEVISDKEYQDLHQSQSYLQDLVQRQGIPVFKQIPDALSCIARLLTSKDDMMRRRPTRAARQEEGSGSGTTTSRRSLSDGNSLGKLINEKISSIVQLFLRIIDLMWRSFTAPPMNQPISPIPFSYYYQQNILREAGRRDIYLGGETNSSWRRQLAIPQLRKFGLTYVCPQEDVWSETLTPDDLSAIENSRLLLFVISSDTRSVSPMLLAAHYIGLDRDVVLCVQYLSEGSVIKGEQMTPQAIKDYNRGRVYLADLAARAGVSVFDEIPEAISAAICKCTAKKQFPFKVRRKQSSVDFFKHLTHLSSLVASQGNSR